SITCLSGCLHPRDLHTFPTRRSSDLRIVGGTTDIWINGELKTTGFASQNNQRGAITTLEINSAGSAVHQFYFDNMVIEPVEWEIDRKSTRLNSSHVKRSYAVFCLKKK